VSIYPYADKYPVIYENKVSFNLAK